MAGIQLKSVRKSYQGLEKISGGEIQVEGERCDHLLPSASQRCRSRRLLRLALSLPEVALRQATRRRVSPKLQARAVNVHLAPTIGVLCCA